MDYNLLSGITLLLAFRPGDAQTWSYTGATGTSNWGSISATCDSNRQSPLSIVDATTVYDGTLGPITATNYDVSLSNQVFANNGHSAQLTITSDHSISGGGLTDTYKVAQLHFHWGSSDSRGSEHTLNGVEYPMEIHVVHYKSSYGDVATAVGNGDGLAVLGAFFEISPTDNQKYDTIIGALASITAKDATTNIGGFTIADLLFSDISAEPYYRYLGSLTTPGCNEAVIWTVFKNTIPISSSQMAQFRTLLVGAAGSAALVDNYRPVQSLYSRTISVSTSSAYRHDTGSSQTLTVLATVLLFLRL